MRRTAAPENLAAIQEAVEKHAPDWKTYSCTLVTPMYGGGVKPGEVDAEMPIRASAIRGQLRFWWRVACARGLSAAEMFKRETALWGGIGDKPTASKVEVRLEIHTQITPEAAFTYEHDDREGKSGQYKPMPKPAPWAHAYSMFPAQGELSDDKKNVAKQPHKMLKPEVRFDLLMRISDELDPGQRKSVTTALRWWASFGGIGARTRRGLGSIWIEELIPVSASEVEQLGAVLKCLAPERDASKAWIKSVDRLKSFRQDKGSGRNPVTRPNSKSPAGRSWWPEADSLRVLSEQTHPDHANRLVNVDEFPRAAFGLPIVYHFKDIPSNREKRAHDFDRRAFDPEDHILEPTDISHDKKRDRMASPLILRPYWNGKQWQPAALLIPGWERALEIDLKFKKQRYQSGPKRWPSDKAAREQLAARIKPLAGRADDPLSAFMQFFAGGK